MGTIPFGCKFQKCRTIGTTYYLKWRKENEIAIVKAIP